MAENQQNETPSLEAGAFEIIALAGQAKSDTLVALKKVKVDEYEEARKLRRKICPFWLFMRKTIILKLLTLMNWFRNY